MKLGSFDITILFDGSFALDGGAMFGIIPRVLWERHFTPDERHRVRISLNTLLIRTGTKNILIDTGIGDQWDEREIDMYGITHDTNLLDQLSSQNLRAHDIDVAINTHLHFDHCGTNTIRIGRETVPTFPRARYVVQRGEFEHACAPNERDRASYISRYFMPVAECGRFDFVEGEMEIVPGIKIIRAPGHNRDMQCVLISSGGQSAIFFSDLAPTTAHIRPSWVTGYDLYPVESVEQKKKLVQQALNENWLCIFEHDPITPAGYLREKEGKISVEPVSLNII